MKVIVTPLHFYMDLGKIWYAVKPIEPLGKLFFEYNTLIASMQDTLSGNNFLKKLHKRFPNQQIDIEFTDRYEIIEPYLTDEEMDMHPERDYESC